MATLPEATATPGVLKCFLQLSSSNEKLRLCDIMVSKALEKMTSDLPGKSVPTLKSTLSIVPTGEEGDKKRAEKLKEKYEQIYEEGLKVTEEMEKLKEKQEKELRRRSQNFRDLVSNRNMGIQEEYTKMLDEVDMQIKSTKEQIANEAHERKRRKLDGKKKKIEEAKCVLREENTQLKEKIREITVNIMNLQQEFNELKQQHEKEIIEGLNTSLEEDDEIRKVETECIQLREEVTLLHEAKRSTLEQTIADSKVLYAEQDTQLEQDLTDLQQLLEDTKASTMQNSVRLHSLLRTLAPTASIGALMARLYQQLSEGKQENHSTVKTMLKEDFLKTCPSVDEGQLAIDQLKSFAMIHSFDSGLLALTE